MRGLLPCPFCGWAAIMREWTSGMHYYRAECSNTEGCDCHGLQHLTLGEAIAAWNRRADARQLALKTRACPMCEDCPDGCPVETPKDSRNIVTNADRIRSMSDEELAKTLADDAVFYEEICGSDERTRVCDNDCVVCALEWFQQPAKEE